METEEAAYEQEKMEFEENTQSGSTPEESSAADEITYNDLQEKEDEQENSVDGRKFVDGLCVGLGIGLIATFAIIWITIFFMPQMPVALTYAQLLSIFIYPLIYLLAVGLVALTAGIVREYYAKT